MQLLLAGEKNANKTRKIEQYNQSNWTKFEHESEKPIT